MKISVKKLTILLTLTLFTVLSLFAQKATNGTEISFKSGLTLANQCRKHADSETFLNGRSAEEFYASNIASTKLKSGINVGVLVESFSNKRRSLGFGINYIQKGCRINAVKHWNYESDSFENVSGDINWVQNYWTIDLPFKFYFPLKGNEIHLLGGLTFGLLNNSVEKGNVKISGVEYDYTNDRGVNNTELGVLFGTGFNYLLPNQNFMTFELIWNRSVISPGRETVPLRQFYYNQTFNFIIGYKFTDKRRNEL